MDKLVSSLSSTVVGFAICGGHESDRTGPVLRDPDDCLGGNSVGHEGVFPDRRADERDPGRQRSP